MHHKLENMSKVAVAYLICYSRGGSK